MYPCSMYLSSMIRQILNVRFSRRYNVTKVSCSESQRSQGPSSRYIVDKDISRRHRRISRRIRRKTRFTRSNSRLANSDDPILSCVCTRLSGHAEISSGNERGGGKRRREEKRSARLPGDLPRAKGHVIFHLSCYPRGELLRIIPRERSRPE